MFFTVSKAWHLCQFLEWKFIEFSGLFHCLIIKVQSNHRLPQSASPDCCAAFASDFVILTQLFFNVKHFFKKFFELFLSCLNCFKVSLIWNSFVMLPHVLWFVNNFFSNIFEIMLLNGEGGIWTLAPLLTTYSLSRGAPSAAWVLLQIAKCINHIEGTLYTRYSKRRVWDSNPRFLSESLVFKTSSLNHSDNSPNSALLSYHSE